jgi:hypothetical protein
MGKVVAITLIVMLALIVLGSGGACIGVFGGLFGAFSGILAGAFGLMAGLIGGFIGLAFGLLGAFAPVLIFILVVLGIVHLIKLV